MQNTDLNKNMEKIYHVLKLFGSSEQFGTNKIVFNNINIIYNCNVIDNPNCISLDVEGERYDINVNDIGLLEAATFIVGKAAHHNRIMGGIRKNLQKT